MLKLYKILIFIGLLSLIITSTPLSFIFNNILSNTILYYTEYLIIENNIYSIIGIKNSKILFLLFLIPIILIRILIHMIFIIGICILAIPNITIVLLIPSIILYTITYKLQKNIK